MNADGKLEKREFDPKYLTAAENTVKMPRYGRMKNENLHGGNIKREWAEVTLFFGNDIFHMNMVSH